MKFDGAVTSTVGLKRARRTISVVGDLGVGVVVREDDAVLEAERDGFLEEIQVGNRGGRVVRIVEPEQLGSARYFVGNRAQVRSEAVLFSEFEKVWLTAVEQASRGVDRVARVGNQNHVARIDNRSREVSDPFLRSDQRADLGLWIEVDAEPAPIPVCGALPIRG